MAVVGAGLGLTVRLNDENEFAKPFVEMRGIDTEGDVKAQIEKAKEAIQEVLETESKLLYDKLADLQ